MHILHLIKTSEGATWAIRLMEQLKNNYDDLTFSVIIPSDGKHFEEYKAVCRNVYEFDYAIGKNLFKNGGIFRDYVTKDKPDIIHSWFTQTTLYARLFLRNCKIPRIFQVVGPAHLEMYLFRGGDIRSAQPTDYWVATSKYIYNKYKKAGIPEDKLFLNYAFIDTDDLKHSEETVTPRDLRKELNLDADVKIIGTASYIYPPKFYESKGIKGHEHLLEGFKELLKQRDDVVLVIAGSTFGDNLAYEEKLKQKARGISPDKIFFTGKFEDVYEVIPNFNLFVYLSRTENLGGVYESLFYKIPTISSNKGALPELVINNETGFNIDPEDTGDLVNKMNILLDATFPEQLKRGRQLVMSTFDKEKIIKQAHSVYCRILNPH